MNSPSLFIVSAPSGTGKTTLNRRLVSEHKDRLAMSVSYTARPIRPGEVDGVDYHYVQDSSFRDLIKRGEMLEYAEVFGVLYGTAKAEVARITALGQSCILEIDVQGWEQVKRAMPEAKSVLILPPSIKELWQRLAGRGTEAEKVRWRRLKTAREEISKGHLYDYFLVNAAFDDAYRDLQSIIINGKNSGMARDQGLCHCQNLVAEFDASEWIQKLAAQYSV